MNTLNILTIEIMPRLRRDLERMDEVERIISEIEDEETREVLTDYRSKKIRYEWRRLNKELARVEREIIELQKEEA